MTLLGKYFAGCAFLAGLGLLYFIGWLYRLLIFRYYIGP